MTLESAHIAGLDGKAIDAAIAASDSGQVTNDDILRKNVAASLSAGHLDVGSVQIPFNIRDGRLSVAATTLQADGATAVISGGYDVTADQTDIRVNLSSLSGSRLRGVRRSRCSPSVRRMGCIERSTSDRCPRGWRCGRSIARRAGSMRWSAAPYGRPS